METAPVSVLVVPGVTIAVAVGVIPGGREDEVVDEVVVVTRGDAVEVLVGDGVIPIVGVGVGMTGVGVGVGVTGVGVGVGLTLVGVGVGVTGVGVGVGVTIVGVGVGVAIVGVGVGVTMVGSGIIGIVIVITRVDVSIGTRTRFVTEFTPVDAVAARA